jgi:hypothetical protein|tara:strand:+ start:1687 stop:2955 length:1269 start_codon:yes stop_codon:yes gene_type:complete
MYWLVETEEQINYLISRQFKDAFVEVIPLSDNIHPANNDVSLVYFKPFIEPKGFMLCVTHSECLGVSKTQVNQLLTQTNTLWTRDKKSTLFYFQIQSLLDVSAVIPPYIQDKTQAHHILYQRYPNKKDINTIVPIVKHYETCQLIYDNVKHGFEEERPPYFDFYNKWAPLAFFGLEKNGIKINKEEFETHFHPVDGDYVYTSYNYNTLTTRPSNKFGGVNYAALNKENGCRKSFIPRNDEFVEYDISAYHPTLAAKLVDYEFGEGDIHQAFADMYKVDYKKAKELTFKQLYGGVFDNYKDLPFFKKTSVYIEDNWKKFNEVGYVEVPTSGYRFYKSKLEDMNPQKLFNYVLQNLETATNVCILIELHKLLRGKNTKLVLYTYDSFLFDLDKSEDLIIKIEKVFKKYQVNVKNSYGENYNFKS